MEEGRISKLIKSERRIQDGNYSMEAESLSSMTPKTSLRH
jgi:hypothetical protein